MLLAPAETEIGLYFYQQGGLRRCGGFYGRKVRHSGTKYETIVWQCNEKYKEGVACSSHDISEEGLKASFVVMFNGLYVGKDRVIDTLANVIETILQDTRLENAIEDKTTYLVGLETQLRQMVEQNASVSQDQKAYQRGFEALFAKYEQEKERLGALEEEQKERLARLGSIRCFLQTLKDSGALLREFDERIFHTLIDTMTVLPRGKVWFKCKSGMEIEGDLVGS